MSDNRSADFTAIFFGAVFLGAWIYFLLFQHSEIPINETKWLFWGFIGILLSAAIYAGMVANDVVRIIVIVLIGISSAILFLALILQQSGEIIATFVTMLGGGLIVYVLPRPAPREWKQIE
ncbi:MAG: hypothetical protein ACPHK8_03215 [Thermoplasmatota archaeon]